MGQGAKNIEDNILYEEEEEEKEPNPVAMWALRSLDVVLLATEKTAKVRCWHLRNKEQRTICISRPSKTSHTFFFKL